MGRRAPPRTPEQQQARWEAYEAQRKKKEALTAKYGEGYLYTAEYRKDEGLPPLKNIAPSVNGQYQSPDYADNWQDYLQQDVTKQGGLTGPTSQVHPITAESTEWDKAYNEWSRGKAGHPGGMDIKKWEMENYGETGPSHSGGPGAKWNRGQPIDSLDRYKQDLAAWKSAWRMPEGGLGKPWLTPAASPTESPTAQTTAPPPNTGGAAQPWDEGVQSIWDDPRSAWLEEQEMGGFNAADYRTGGKLNTPEEFAKLTRAQQEIVQKPENTFQQAGPGGTTATGGTRPPPSPTGGGSDFNLQNMPEGMNAFGWNPQTGEREWKYIDPSTLPAWGPGTPGWCFVAGTKVAVSNKGTKNIEDVEVGDLVACYDTISDTLEEGAVTHTFTHPDTDGYLVVNESLGVTPNHEIYTGTGWVSAGNLEVGDNIQMIGGGLTKVSNIEKVDKSVTTHNLEVANRHNYYADGVLVHNKTRRPPKPGDPPTRPRPGPARPGYVQGQMPPGWRGTPQPHPMGGGAAPWLAGIRPPPGAHMRPGVRGPKQPMISGTASPPPNPMGGGGGGSPTRIYYGVGGDPNLLKAKEWRNSPAGIAALKKRKAAGYGGSLPPPNPAGPRFGSRGNPFR